MSEKKVNSNSVSTNAQAFEAISDDAIIFRNIDADEKTTLTAKYNSLKAVGDSQSTMTTLSLNLKDEKKNIESIGAAFEECDSLISTLMKGL